MAYYPQSSFTYSSSFGWVCDIQAGPSSHTRTWGETSVDSPFDVPLHADPLSIPISRDSTLAGAVTPANPTPQGGEVHQLVQPAQPQPAVPAFLQVAAQPPLPPTQLAQPVNPQPVALPHLGVQIQNPAPQPAVNNRRRAAYLLSTPPTRHPRQPPGTIKFCRVEGCKRWTRDQGKKLARHRASHFPGLTGVACPHCNVVFTRSGACGDHLKQCNRQKWDEIAAAKGKQDCWGRRIGQDLINQKLVDGVFISWAWNEL